MKRSSAYYPVFLNISGKKCIVIGGGQVALRKTMALLERDAAVQVISPVVCSELNKLAEKRIITVSRRDYHPGDARGAFVIIAATDNHALNQQVVAEARAANVLVNVVDNAELSDFIVPSCLSRGDITIAISTSGRSPALARKIRSRLEAEFGKEYGTLAVLLSEVRAEVKRQGIVLNGDDWQEALDLDSLLDLLQKDKRDEAKTLILNQLKAIHKQKGGYINAT